MATTSRERKGAAASGERRDVIAARLATTRARTLELIDGLSEDALNRVHDPLMSPIVWDLGHIATFEDLWLVQRAMGKAPLQRELGEVYDPFAAPRADRGKLPYLRSEDCFRYMETVRARTLEGLAEVDLSAQAEPLLAGGFVYEMVLRHEQQHSETVLQTLQLMTSERYEPPKRYETPSPGASPDGAMVFVAGGPFEMGAGGDGFAYDNERPGHVRELGDFLIDSAPVTNAAMSEFVTEGGYERREWWSREGWQWREREGATMPHYWQRDGDGFAVRSLGEMRSLDPALPVCHVSWFEADAFARYVGKRLPTEAEWERAASWCDETKSKHTYPWGDSPPDRSRANLDQLAFAAAPAGCYGAGASPCGALQMIGDVWEWTASGFEAYPGFSAFPYREYSEEFFGEPFKVLRGGAWATQPEAVTTTFRNWDYPQRRQIFAGFRCAADGDQR